MKKNNCLCKSFDLLKKYIKLFYACFDRNTAFLLVLCMTNLFFLHYYIYKAGYLEWTFLYSIPANICSIFFDINVLLFFFLFLSGKRLKPALALTYGLTLMWSIVNVFYARFFYTYMPLTAIGQAGGLQDGNVMDTIIAGFQWSDLFYIISLTLFVIIYRHTQKKQLSAKSVLNLLIVPILSLFITILVYSAYHFAQSRYRNNWELYGFRIQELLFDVNRAGTPHLSRFQAGCVRVALFELYDMFDVFELTPEQRQEISAYYFDRSERMTSQEINQSNRNVIFILLESFLSAPIGLKVDGKEITPFLNRLVQDSTVYYNGQMKANITCGESGDGQFIYLNGILPLRNKMTVGVVKDNTLPSLPRLLAEKYGVSHSEIIIPTQPNMWQQADVNVAYGISSMFSQNDIPGKDPSQLNDEEIFSFAAKSLDTSKVPFFELILSVSTHSPYNDYMGANYLAGCTSLPEEYRNYLNTCHYTDEQLRKYFDTLKEKDLYDNTLIVIASDHHAHLERLHMDGRITSHIPLIIVNGKKDKGSMWQGEFNQLDVYTTILDILGIENEWLGLGHTLLNPHYHSSISENAYRISELIIEGDYFAKPAKTNR